MKKFFVTVILLTATYNLHAQIENIPEDSISFYLCKKWTERARFIDKKQIGLFGDPLIYEFKSDNSFTKKLEEKPIEGSWQYDSTKKVVQLFLDNRRDFYVVALTKNEMLLSADLHEGDKKGSGIMVLFKSTE